MEFMDIFNDDAFSLISLTAAINEVDHVPGRAGQLVFSGVAEGVRTTTVAFERKGEALSLIQTSQRGAPAPKETSDKSNIRATVIPHIKLEDTIRADEVAGVREFGSTDQLRSVESVVATRLSKMSLRHDLTLEHHRLGALKGIIRDANGSTLTDLFDLFGIQNSLGAAAPESFDFNLEDYSAPDAFDDSVRIKCMAIHRFVKRKAKTVVPSTAKVWAFCGEEFFDKLIEHPSVKEVYKDTAEQIRRLGANYANGAFEFGGIVFENYQGTDDEGDTSEGTNDEGTVGIGRNEARLFLTGVPGLYAEYFAPATFMETVNSLGLPRYAKAAPDQKYNEFVELHTQQNPLPICLRPQTLVRAVSAASFL
jgi:hypothetical protein